MFTRKIFRTSRSSFPHPMAYSAGSGHGELVNETNRATPRSPAEFTYERRGQAQNAGIGKASMLVSMPSRANQKILSRPRGVSAARRSKPVQIAWPDI